MKCKIVYQKELINVDDYSRTFYLIEDEDGFPIPIYVAHSKYIDHEEWQYSVSEYWIILDNPVEFDVLLDCFRGKCEIEEKSFEHP